MRRFAALVVAVVLIVAACGDDDEPAVSSTTTSAPDGGSTTTSSTGGTTSTTTGDQPLGRPSTTPVTTPGFPDTGQDQAHLTGVRVGHHRGFDRVVFEFDGPPPGHQVRYVDPPIREDASGNEVDVDGSAFLEITMTPASGVDLTTDRPVETYTGPDRIDGSGDPLAEVVRTGDFEAVLTWVAGVDGRRPFSVTALEGPTRLVVDVVAG